MLKNLNLNDEKTKDFIAGVIALVFVVAAGYLAFNKFNDSERLELGKGGSVLTENGEDAMTENSEGDINGAMSDTKGTIEQYPDWQATNYDEGDIKSGQYTVKSGDTLWEIAEAVYGDGAMWTKILDANSTDIGYLPNGSQALIVTGQTILIP